MKLLLLKRVCYGKINVPLAKREYVTHYRFSPVGCVCEWRKYAVKEKYAGLDIKDIDLKGTRKILFNQRKHPSPFNIAKNVIKQKVI